MKNRFLITSAINSRFGAISLNDRMVQTYFTIDSIKKYAPGAEITLIDMCGDPLTSDQVKSIETNGADVVIYNDENVQKIYKIESQDIVKNLTEMMCFGDYLNRNEFFDEDRVFKISGRYTLNENFKPEEYTAYLSGHIVFSGKHNSQFPPEVTGNKPDDNYQYMSRLWSFSPKLHLNMVRNAYFKMANHMVERLNAGGYIDIEHLLYQHMPKDEIAFKIPSGLTGFIAPNKQQIND